jgi:hypothetical protein
VRLVYIDEAGTGSERDEPITVVAAVIINGDSQWLAIEKHLDGIIQSLVPKESRQKFEFHAKDLFHGTKRYRDWGKAKRWEILDALLDTFRLFEIPIRSGVVLRSDVGKLLKPRQGISAQQWSHIMAFVACLLSVESWFEEHAPNEVGICIADNTDRYMSNLLKGVGRQVRDTKRLGHLIDAVSFQDSYLSIGVQLADVCNFLIKRECSGSDTAGLFKKIKSSSKAVFFAPSALD